VERTRAGMKAARARGVKPRQKRKLIDQGESRQHIAGGPPERGSRDALPSAIVTTC
jgi:DNA invertase Pin-like site-specific DNA recombinase